MEKKKTKRNIPIFVGENYNIWKFRIRSLLSELDVIHVIEKPVPVTPDNKWKRAEQTAKNVIIEYLSDAYISHVGQESTSKEILSTLDNIFERKSTVKQLATRKKLLNMKLQGDTTLNQHFMQFDILISELATSGATVMEGDKVSQLLLSFPPAYDGIITAIETLSEDEC